MAKKTKTGQTKPTKTRGFRLKDDVYSALRSLADRSYGGNVTMALEMTLVEAFRLRHHSQSQSQVSQ